MNETTDHAEVRAPSRNRSCSRPCGAELQTGGIVTTANATLTTQIAVEAVAWGRAPRYDGGSVNSHIVCADGFTISAQASDMHYAQDSHVSGEAAYWRGIDAEPVYPFVTFELGAAHEALPELDEWESGGVWAWVPRQVVADLLDSHGGAVAWKGREE